MIFQANPALEPTMSDLPLPHTEPDAAAELEAMRHAAYPDPAESDKGETLMWTGASIGAVGAGVVAAAAICPACMVGLAPLAAVAAPAVFGAGLYKRWKKKRAIAPTGA
jgi:hypothetical protein